MVVFFVGFLYGYVVVVDGVFYEFVDCLFVDELVVDVDLCGWCVVCVGVVYCGDVLGGWYYWCVYYWMVDGLVFCDDCVVWYLWFGCYIFCFDWCDVRYDVCFCCYGCWFLY